MSSRSSVLTKDDYFTVEDYLEFEKQSETRHEYSAGEIISMAGASRRHNLINGNAFGELRNKLKGKSCEAYMNDMRVRTTPDDYAYPDVVVVCSEPQFEDEEYTLLNPTVLIEVLSKTTEARDRDDKLHDYFLIDSVTDYILIAQDKMLVDHYIKKSNDEWTLRSYTKPDDVIKLSSIGCELMLSELYAQVKFPPQRRLQSVNDVHSETEKEDQ